jgi:hypothetical protein
MSGSDVSSLFNGANSSIVRGSFGASGKIRGGHAAIGGFDEIVQMRKDASNSYKSVANVDKHLESLSLGCTQSDFAKGGTAMVNTKKSSRSADDFLREWKRYCTSAKATLSFLTTIDSSRPFEDRLKLQPDVICKEYFSADIDSDILGDIVEALHLLIDTHVTPSVITNTSGPASMDDDENDSCHVALGTAKKIEFSETSILLFTHNWLEAISSCGRFGLSISFLMPDQRLKLKELCSFLKKSNEDNAAVDELLRRYYETL